MKIQTNTTNILKLLQHSFTSRDTFVRELLQNCNRAGATEVGHEYDNEERKLIVTDNGCGITDMTKLLDVGSSGWDDQSTGPYGVGFLSAIFACEEFEVHSNGKVLSANTAELVNGGEASIGPSHVTTGTQVVLHGLKMQLYPGDLAKLYDGLPFNGGGKWTRGLSVDIPDVGTLVYIGDRTANGEHRYSINLHLALFLQGFGIAHTPLATSYLTDLTIANFALHLDHTKFFGRMPDRDCLLNCEEVSFDKLVRDYAIGLIEKIPVDSDKAFRMVASYAPQRIADLDVMRCVATLPEEFSYELRLKDDRNDREWRDGAALVGRTELESYGDKVIVCTWETNPDNWEERLELRGLIKARDDHGYCVIDPLAAPAWVPAKRRIEARVVAVHNEQRADKWVLCDSVDVGIYDRDTDELLFQWNETEWCFDDYLIDTKEIPEYMFKQDDGYADTNDGCSDAYEWLEDRVTEAWNSAQENLNLALGGDITDLLRNTLCYDNRLAGRTFTVAYNEIGRPVVTLVEIDHAHCS